MRYFQPTLKDYTSSFVPTELPFELMLKSLDNKQAAYDKAQADIDSANELFNIGSPMYFKQSDIDNHVNQFKKEYEQLASDFASNKLNPTTASRSLVNLKRKFDNNPLTKLYKTEAALAAQDRQNMLKPEMRSAIGSNYNNGNIQYINPNETTLDDLSRIHNYQTPGDFVKDHSAEYSMIHPQITEAIKRSGYGFTIDKKTGIPIFTDTKGADVTKEVNETILKPYFDRFALENYENSDKQSVDYMRRSGQSVKDYADRLRTSYLGYGVYDKEFAKTDYQPVKGDGSGNGLNNMNPENTYYPTAAIPTPRGVENTKKFVETVNDFFKGKHNQILTFKTDEGKTIRQTVSKDQKWSDFSEQHKNLIAHYFDILDEGKGTTKWAAFAKDIRDGKDMQWLQSQSVYRKQMEKDFSKPEFLKRMSLIDVNTNNTVYDMDYGAEALYNKTGVKQGTTAPPTLQDLLASNLSVDSKWVKVTDDNKIEPIKQGQFKKEFAELTPEDKSKIMVGFGKYTPDNNLKLSIGDGDNWANAYSVVINGQKYIVQAPRKTGINPKTGNSYQQEEKQNEAINELYNTLRFSLPGKYIPIGNNVKALYDDEFIWIDANGQIQKGGYFDQQGNAYGEDIRNLFTLRPIGKQQ